MNQVKYIFFICITILFFSCCSGNGKKEVHVQLPVHSKYQPTDISYEIKDFKEYPSAKIETYTINIPQPYDAKELEEIVKSLRYKEKRNVTVTFRMKDSSILADDYAKCYVDNDNKYKIELYRRRDTQKSALASNRELNIPYWKTIVDKYPKNRKVIAVCEVLKDDLIMVIYSENSKFYSHAIYQKQEKVDTPDKLIKKNDNTYVLASDPNESYKVKQNTVDGLYEGEVADTWIRLK